MAIDVEVIKAISKAVEEENQPDKVAKRVIAWLNKLSEESLNKEENSRHLDTVLKAIKIISGD